MASLDSLPPDQRAVLQLVLQRGRSYDDIAKLLSIDRAAVRQRALSALDALGPQARRVSPEWRSLITDYLLGQLPPAVSEDTAARLAESPAERAWARVVASELAPLAGERGVTEIPSEARPAAAPEPVEDEYDEPAAAEPVRDRVAAALSPSSARAADARHDTPRIPQDLGLPTPGQPAPSSRRGGAILLGLGALVVVVVVVIIVATSGGSSKKSSTPSAGTGTTPATSTTGTGTGTTPTPVAQINLTSPDPGSKAAGIAQVVRQGTQTGIVIAAAGVAPNTKANAYAVWLYKSATQAHLLGFVNPGVGSNGKLSTAGALPTNASNYSQLLVTLETQATPKQPGKIILQGALSLGGG